MIIKILAAQIDDVSEIEAISRQNLIDLATQAIAPNAHHQATKGFLTQNIGTSEISRMIIDPQNNLILIAKENNSVQGFIIASDLDANNDFNAYLQEANIDRQQKIIYYRQIAKKPGSGKIGEALLSEFLSKAKSQGYNYALCRIIHGPINNQRSIAFHQKFGFKLIGQAQEKDRLAGIYVCALN
jgi:predicted GNAT superfamily acetyltransferase